MSACRGVVSVSTSERAQQTQKRGYWMNHGLGLDGGYLYSPLTGKRSVSWKLIRYDSNSGSFRTQTAAPSCTFQLVAVQRQKELCQQRCLWIR